MHWHISHRADPIAAVFSDGHYSRQKPGTPQFVKPGRCMVLMTEDAKALWVTSWPFKRLVKHEWAGAWENSLFRNESEVLSSVLILEALAVTRWYHAYAPTWRVEAAPASGLITFVDAEKTKKRRSKRAQPGACYLHAGFRHVGYTKSEGLNALQLPLVEMPDPIAPIGVTVEMELFV